MNALTQPRILSPTQEDTPWPTGWRTSTIGDIAEVNPRSFSIPPANEDLVSFLPMQAIHEGDGQLDLGRARPWREVCTGYTRFQEGDVIFAKITPCMENGKVSVARGLKDGRAAGSTELHVFRPKEGIHPDFLRYFLLTENVRRKARAGMTGTAGQLRVPAAVMEQMEVPIPPTAEQHRIVEAIESRLARLDAAVRALERAQANLKRYLVSTLGSAFPEENRGSNSDFVELVTVCDTATGGTPRRDTPRYYGGSFPWIKSGELHDGLVTHSEETITQEALDNSNAKVFPAGTVCMALYGATVGKLGILGLDAATNQAVCAFFPHRELNSKYLFWFLRSVRGKLLSNRSGGAQPNISQTIVRHLRVRIPSVEQQYALVAEIERRLSVAEEASAAAERAFHRCGRLRNSILKSAFEGRLVPQDPKDESASALLERIKREGSLASQSMTRKRKTARAS